MKRNLLLIIFILASTILNAQALKAVDTKTRNDITTAMEASRDCWNKGNLDCFMEVYWKSDLLRFIGQNGITFGYDKVLNNYKKKYSTPEARGTLNYDLISMEFLDHDTVLLLGKYTIKKEAGEDISGHYSLIWRKIKGKWKITVDHTS